MERHKDFDSLLRASILELMRENSFKFHSLNRFIKDEFEGGKREFRLVVSDNGDAYIHPLGKDGETHNIKFNL